MDKKIKYFIYLFVFVCGVAVMFLEMAAARMMAPYFGSSIFVWGNIIGIVLIALSAGYYFGGRIADKYPQKKTLMFFVICAGIYTSFIPIVFKFINDSLNFTHYFGSDFLLLVILGSFLSSLLFFAVPIFILGFVSPYAIRLTASDVINAGKVAGSLYAFSTLGSIVGTFGAAFVIVPFWGSRETVYLASFLLLVISAIGLIKKPYLLILALLPVALYFLQAGAAIKDSEEIIYEDDSMYQYIQVKERDGIKVLSVNEGMGTQSIYDSENILTNKYYDYLSISPYISNKVVKNGLIIGLAGGTLSRQINHFFPGMELTGIEIDPGVIKAANEHFNLESQNVKVIPADGRMFVKYGDEKKYDIIFIDAYSQELYIPWHLTTREFFQEVSTRLNDEGMVVMNVVSNSQESHLMKGILGSLKANYAHVYIMTLKNGTSNVVVASADSLDLDKINEINNPELEKIAEYYNLHLEEVNNNYQDAVFTDNRAPVELLSDKMWLKEIFTL